MRKAIKAFFDPITLAIIGIVISVVAGVVAFPNWESHKEFTLTFAKNVPEKKSDYLSVNTDELMVVQTTGNSSCKYSLYYQSRVQSSYTTIKTGLSFAHNNEWDGETYSLSPCWWNDVRFKAKKTAGTGTKSELAFSLGRTSD